MPTSNKGVCSLASLVFAVLLKFVLTTESFVLRQPYNLNVTKKILINIKILSCEREFVYMCPSDSLGTARGGEKRASEG